MDEMHGATTDEVNSSRDRITAVGERDDLAHSVELLASFSAIARIEAEAFRARRRASAAARGPRTQQRGAAKASAPSPLTSAGDYTIERKRDALWAAAAVREQAAIAALAQRELAKHAAAAQDRALRCAAAAAAEAEAVSAAAETIVVEQASAAAVAVARFAKRAAYQCAVEAVECHEDAVAIERIRLVREAAHARFAAQQAERAEEEAAVAARVAAAKRAAVAANTRRAAKRAAAVEAKRTAEVAAAVARVEAQERATQLAAAVANEIERDELEQHRTLQSTAVAETALAVTIAAAAAPMNVGKGSADPQLRETMQSQIVKMSASPQPTTPTTRSLLVVQSKETDELQSQPGVVTMTATAALQTQPKLATMQRRSRNPLVVLNDTAMHVQRVQRGRIVRRHLENGTGPFEVKREFAMLEPRSAGERLHPKHFDIIDAWLASTSKVLRRDVRRRYRLSSAGDLSCRGSDGNWRVCAARGAAKCVRRIDLFGAVLQIERIDGALDAYTCDSVAECDRWIAGFRRARWKVQEDGKASLSAAALATPALSFNSAIRSESELRSHLDSLVGGSGSSSAGAGRSPAARRKGRARTRGVSPHRRKQQQSSRSPSTSTSVPRSSSDELDEERYGSRLRSRSPACARRRQVTARASVMRPYSNPSSPVASSSFMGAVYTGMGLTRSGRKKRKRRRKKKLPRVARIGNGGFGFVTNLKHEWKETAYRDKESEFRAKENAIVCAQRTVGTVVLNWSRMKQLSTPIDSEMRAHLYEYRDRSPGRFRAGPRAIDRERIALLATPLHIANGVRRMMQHYSSRQVPRGPQVTPPKRVKISPARLREAMNRLASPPAWWAAADAAARADKAMRERVANGGVSKLLRGTTTSARKRKALRVGNDYTAHHLSPTAAHLLRARAIEVSTLTPLRQEQLAAARRPRGVSMFNTSASRFPRDGRSIDATTPSRASLVATLEKDAVPLSRHILSGESPRPQMKSPAPKAASATRKHLNAVRRAIAQRFPMAHSADLKFNCMAELRTVRGWRRVALTLEDCQLMVSRNVLVKATDHTFSADDVISCTRVLAVHAASAGRVLEIEQERPGAPVEIFRLRFTDITMGSSAHSKLKAVWGLSVAGQHKQQQKKTALTGPNIGSSWRVDGSHKMARVAIAASALLDQQPTPRATPRPKSRSTSRTSPASTPLRAEVETTTTKKRKMLSTVKRKMFAMLRFRKKASSSSSSSSSSAPTATSPSTSLSNSAAAAAESEQVAAENFLMASPPAKSAVTRIAEGRRSGSSVQQRLVMSSHLRERKRSPLAGNGGELQKRVAQPVPLISSPEAKDADTSRHNKRVNVRIGLDGTWSDRQIWLIPRGETSTAWFAWSAPIPVNAHLLEVTPVGCVALHPGLEAAANGGVAHFGFNCAKAEGRLFVFTVATSDITIAVQGYSAHAAMEWSDVFKKAKEEGEAMGGTPTLSPRVSRAGTPTRSGRSRSSSRASSAASTPRGSPGGSPRSTPRGSLIELREDN